MYNSFERLRLVFDSFPSLLPTLHPPRCKRVLSSYLNLRLFVIPSFSIREGVLLGIFLVVNGRFPPLSTLSNI